jgi:hypothetical protein
MNKTLPLLFLLLFGIVSHMAAQTNSATFAYGAVNSGNCSAITEWNGVVDAYPADMGEVCFNFGENPYSGMEIPWQLGFPNNGYLLENTPFTWAPPVFTNGNATTDGSTYHQAGVAAYTGYGAGVTVSVTVNFTVHVHKACRYSVCRTYLTDTATGGAGMVSQ